MRRLFMHVAVLRVAAVAASAVAADAAWVLLK